MIFYSFIHLKLFPILLSIILRFKIIIQYLFAFTMMIVPQSKC